VKPKAVIGSVAITTTHF